MAAENKIVAYLLLTALMVATFICAVAISHRYHSAIAWTILLVMNLGLLVYLLRR